MRSAESSSFDAELDREGPVDEPTLRILTGVRKAVQGIVDDAFEDEDVVRVKLEAFSEELREVAEVEVSAGGHCLRVRVEGTD